MDKPPEHQGAEIVPLFKQYEPKSPEQSPKPPSARIVELPDTPRRQSGDEGSDTSLEGQPQGAEIIEFPNTPTSLRQQASELIGKFSQEKKKNTATIRNTKRLIKKKLPKPLPNYWLKRTRN